MTTALYYPNFSPNDSWLKCSLLYWEDIRRIVPASVLPHVLASESRDCREAAAEGCLIATDCHDYRDAATREFVHKLEPILRSKNPNHRKWIEQAFSKTYPERLHRTKVSQAWLHSEKVSSQIANVLRDVGLVRQEREWLEMPPLAAALYMACLATEMSRQIRIPVLTDRLELAEGVQYLLFSDPPSTRELDSERTLLFKLGIRFPRPQSLNAVSMKKVLDFRNRTAAEREQFRLVFERFLEQVVSVNDRNHLDDVIRDERRNLDRAMRDHRRSLRDLGIKGLWAFMSITVPTSFVAVTETIGEFIDTRALGVAGVALGSAVAWSGIRADYTSAVAGNPWHYAWKVQKSFT